MGLLSKIMQSLSGQSQGNEKPNSLLEAVIGLVGNPQSGGLEGLLNRFKGAGLGEVFSSWISTEQNQPIDPNQVETVLGEDKIQEIATKLGVSPKEVSQNLAKLLPEVVDKITPQGNIPSGESLGERLGTIKKLLGG